MGKVKHPLAVKLVIGMISREENLFKEVEKELSQKFGSIDFESPLLSFHYTNHYKKEMGANLKRKFVSFAKLINPAKIVEIKLFTNQIEKNFLYPRSNRRRLNLDPGYVTLAKLVLATSKNFQHRIYIREGIYADITLRYRRGKGFVPWEWTYPDYKSKEYLEIFNHLREIYRHQILKC